MRFLFVFFALLFPAALSAQPIDVLSGEHDEFTRLAFQIPEGAEWKVAQNGRDVEVMISGATDGFDTSRVYERIGRERITSTTSTAQKLAIEVACECGARSFLFSPTLLVVDFSESFEIPEATEDLESVVASNAAETAEPANDSPEATATTPPSMEIPPVSMPEAVADARSDDPASAASGVKLPLVIEDNNTTSLFQASPNLENDVETLQQSGQTDELLELQNRLNQQIGSAATQGILEFSASDRPIPKSQSKPEGVEADNEDVLQPLFPPDDAIQSNMRISDAIASDQQVATQKTSTDGLLCEHEELFAIYEWGEVDEFSSQVAKYRNALFGEFDKIDHKAQVGLARTYLYFGFGAEALTIIEMDPDIDKVDAALIAIANILEYGPSQFTERFSQYAECDDDTALWAILSASVIPSDKPVNAAAALRALDKMPMHLRRILAPELSKRLRLRGEESQAVRALRAISRTGKENSPAKRLETAELEIANGSFDEAALGLKDVANTNSLEAPQALVRFIDLQIETGKPISKKTAQLAEAYASEYRHTELGPEIKRAHIMALAKSGQFDAAFEVLNVAEELSLDTGAIIGQLHEVLESDAADINFLKRTLQLSPDDLEKIPGRTLLKIAKRLQDLGFSKEALETIASVDPNSYPRTQNLLRGEISLSLNKPTEAIEYAKTFEGEEFTRLRADALSSLGEYSQAAGIYASINEATLAEESAWLSAEYDEQLIKDTVLGRVATYQEEQNLPVSLSSLSNVDQIVSKSSTFLDEVSEILSSNSLQVSQ